MADENSQLELDFPSPDGFPSYDDVDSEEAESELPTDSFDEASVDEDEVGCCIR